MASPATEVQVGERTVRISNPDRVYFSTRGETKLDLVNYYLSVGDGIVRALRERPCMLHRYPDGVDGEKIYQKRLPKGAPDWVETAEVEFPSGRSAGELCVTELASVVWAVQMSTVEFHPWHSRRADTEHPDELRIDLDPQPGTGLAEAKRVAASRARGARRAGRGRLAQDVGVARHPRLRAHRARCSASARCAARRSRFAREIERRAPALVTTAWWKEERGGQVFVDYNQNARDRTIALRTRSARQAVGPVSAPVTWAELPDVEIADFTIATMPARFAQLGDLARRHRTTRSGRSSRCWNGRRDERRPQPGDAPYPPNYPKQEGEPPRVQPSKKVLAHWDDEGNRVDGNGPKSS